MDPASKVTGAGLPKPFGTQLMPPKPRRMDVKLWDSMLHLTLLWSGPSLPLDESVYSSEKEKKSI